MSFLAMSSQGQKIRLESGFHTVGPPSRSRSPVKNIVRPMTIERSQSSDCRRKDHVYENHSVTTPLSNSLQYRAPCHIGEFRFSKDLDALSLLVKDGPQVPMLVPRSPPMNGLAPRKCQISDDEDIQSIRKALQSTKSAWKLKNEKITELLCERELELEALKRERASIEEERKKYEATLKKKDREIEQLKERVRSMILPEITTDTSEQTPEVPSGSFSPLDEGALLGTSLDGNILNGINLGGQDSSTDGNIQKTAMDSMQRILCEKKEMLKEKTSLQKTAKQEMDTAEERLLSLKEEYDDLISSPYYRTRDFFNETQGLNTEITKMENQVEEKKLALLDVTHILDGLQEFCESMEGALNYLESMAENVTTDEHYWNIHDHDPLVKNVTLEEASWYWGDINKEMTYSLLAHKPSGYFIVRNSTTQPGNYVLSVKVNVGVDEENKINDVLMVHIKCIDGKFGFFKSKSQFASISELITYYMHHPLTELNPSLVTNLKAPVSRFTNSMPRSTLARSTESPFSARKQAFYKYMDENQLPQLRDSVELSDVLDHLSDLTPLWEVIGYGLGVSDFVKTLRCSEKDPRTKCLMMLEEWIERGQDNTWSKLLDVLSRNRLNSTVVKLQRAKSPSSY